MPPPTTTGSCGRAVLRRRLQRDRPAAARLRGRVPAERPGHGLRLARGPAGPARATLLAGPDIRVNHPAAIDGHRHLPVSGSGGRRSSTIADEDGEVIGLRAHRDGPGPAPEGVAAARDAVARHRRSSRRWAAAGEDVAVELELWPDSRASLQLQTTGEPDADVAAKQPGHAATPCGGASSPSLATTAGHQLHASARRTGSSARRRPSTCGPAWRSGSARRRRVSRSAFPSSVSIGAPGEQGRGGAHRAARGYPHPAWGCSPLSTRRAARSGCGSSRTATARC